ncbi:hypothetical protein [Rudanella lutea]|jgi:hypothetical protein|uniref:hypothetical protein n=1 Tax=Rudanella lutea TaxID=451374 RepID=UPI00035E7E45|nr:hypothetical protein [Rudanella lutea]
MESYAPSPDDMMNQNSSRVPTGMEQDVRADEDIIDQTGAEPAAADTELQRAPVEPPQAGQSTPVDDLASSIAYALDGSGRGETNPVSPQQGPIGPEHKPITEGTTGASLRDEEDNLKPD